MAWAPGIEAGIALPLGQTILNPYISRQCNGFSKFGKLSLIVKMYLFPLLEAGPIGPIKSIPI
ncbi:hypothetical protein EMCRGX_G002278 [Ephydatia muelleri]